MGTAQSESDDLWIDRWEGRLQTVSFYVVPYIALGCSSALALVLDPGSGNAPLVTIGVVLATAAWLAGVRTVRTGAGVAPALTIGYYFGLLALIGVLIWRSPWFGFAVVAGYAFALDLLPTRWKVVGIVASATLAASSQAGGFASAFDHLALFGVAVAFNALVVGAFSTLGWLTGEQSERRRRTLAQLSEAHRQLAETMAENAGLHAQLLVQAHEAGTHDERQRMAREIHDTLAQGLAGIITQLQAAEGSTNRQHHIDNAIELARQSLTEARRSVRAMRPEQLDQAGLVDALSGVVTRWSELTGTSAELIVTGTAEPLHPDVEVVLLRAAQEALANVAKHAAASRVGLTLSYMGDEVVLDVRDDGVGFTPSAGSEEGFGLVGMAQRVELLAGTLEVESAPGSGTAISARLPLGGSRD
jgi:signal transduction histidine kinase